MKIPNVILDARDYRKKILSDPYFARAEDAIINYSNKIENLKNSSNSDIRVRTYEAMNFLKEEVGYDMFKRIAINLKQIDGLEGSDFTDYKGKEAEVFYEITTEEFVRIHELTDWHIEPSLSFKPKNGSSTEMDLVICTPSIVIVIEVKSYKGVKTLTGQCNVKTSNVDKDIFSQNGLHCKHFWEMFGSHALTNIGAIKSVYADFSIGEIEDKRTENDKRLMPVVDEDNFISFLTSVKALNAKKWKPSLITALIETPRHSMGQHMDALGLGGM